MAHYQIVFEAGALRSHGDLTRVKHDYFSSGFRTHHSHRVNELGFDPHVLMHQLMKSIIETP